MENRGGQSTSIEELMRSSNNSNMSDDDSIVNRILSEINSDKENMQQHQQQQQQQQQEMQQQQQQEMQQQQQKQQMMRQQMAMEKQRQMQHQMIEKRIAEENVNKSKKGEQAMKIDDMCENVSLMDEFKSTIVFFLIFIVVNLTQFNNVLCSTLSIENNNILVLLKGFISTILFFFVNKLINKYF